MSALPRRGFLSGLVSLPLIGGGVTLIGNPTGVAVAPHQELLFAYRQWLDAEGKLLGRELFPELGEKASRFIPWSTAAANFHFPDHCTDWRKVPQPSTRAALVLSAVGVPIGRLGGSA